MLADHDAAVLALLKKPQSELEWGGLLRSVGQFAQTSFNVERDIINEQGLAFLSDILYRDRLAVVLPQLLLANTNAAVPLDEATDAVLIEPCQTGWKLNSDSASASDTMVFATVSDLLQFVATNGYKTVLKQPASTISRVRVKNADPVQLSVAELANLQTISNFLVRSASNERSSAKKVHTSNNAFAASVPVAKFSQAVVLYASVSQFLDKYGFDKEKNHYYNLALNRVAYLGAWEEYDIDEDDSECEEEEFSYTRPRSHSAPIWIMTTYEGVRVPVTIPRTD